MGIEKKEKKKKNATEKKQYRRAILVTDKKYDILFFLLVLGVSIFGKSSGGHLQSNKKFNSIYILNFQTN